MVKSETWKDHCRDTNLIFETKTTIFVFKSMLDMIKKCRIFTTTSSLLIIEMYLYLYLWICTYKYRCLTIGHKSPMRLIHRAHNSTTAQ